MGHQLSVAKASLLDRVSTFLHSSPRVGVCHRCLADAVNAETKERMHETVSKTKVGRAFDREFASCAVCGKNRLLLLARAP
jgi:hypothetical protein